MTSVLDAQPVAGFQRPRYECVPTSNGSAGQEAVELAASAGLILDPWQAYVLENSLGERRDGRWAAREVGLIVSRQNGKGSILEARELAGLFLLDEMEIVHTAHQFKTSADHFLRIKSLIVNTPDLFRQVRPRGIRESHGEEGITLNSGARLRFVARSVNGSGRGFAKIDLLAIDEAFQAERAAMSSLLPMQLAARNAQTWYTSSVEDKGTATDFLKRLRDRGRAGKDPSLAYFEYSAPEGADPDNPTHRAMANPGLGIRLAYEDLQALRNSMDDLTFLIECMSVWPDFGVSAVIPANDWDGRINADARIANPVFALDVSPMMTHAAIAVAGDALDGLHTDLLLREGEDLVDSRAGTGWVLPAVADLLTRNPGLRLVMAGNGQAKSLAPDIEALGVEVELIPAAEVAAACGLMYKLATGGGLTHSGQPELSAAVGSAQWRDTGEGAQVFGRRKSGEITPLYAATLAVWKANQGVDPLDNIF